MMNTEKKYLRISIGDNDFTSYINRELFNLILKLFQYAKRPITESDISAIRKFILEVWPKFIQLEWQVYNPNKEIQPHLSEQNIAKYITEHLKVEIVGVDRLSDFDNAEDILIPLSASQDDYVFVK